MNDLETFAPIPRIVTLNDGSEVSILPLRLGQMPAFTAATKDIAPLLMLADYLTILDQHSEDAIDTVIAAGFKREFAAALWQDETVAILSAIYEVNSNFFIQRLRPAMTKAAAGAREAIAVMTTAVMPQPSLGSDNADAT